MMCRNFKRLGAVIAIFMALCPAAFGEIYLHSAQDALNCARAHNKEYDLQEQYLAESVRLAKKSVGAFLPTFEFSWSENDNVPIASDDQRTKTIGAGVTQKIFDGGKSIIEYKMQINASRLEFYAFQKSYENFQGEVVRCYYQNLLALAKCRVQTDAVENAHNVLRLAELQLSQGMITKSEYIATEISVGKMELQLKAYKDAAESSRRELASLLGLSQKEKLVFCSQEIMPQEIALAITAVESAEKDALVQNAIANSIDLKKLDAEIDWAKKQRRIQKMVFMPSLSVSGGIEFSGKHYPLTMPSYKLKFIVGFENNPWLPTNVSGGAGFREGRMNNATSAVDSQGIINTTYFSQMRMSKIGLSQKVLSRQKAVWQIENTVLELLENIGQSVENLSLNLQMLELSKKKVELQKIQLEEGLITKTDFLDSINECAQQKIQVLELRNQHDYLQTQLEILTGRKSSEKGEVEGKREKIGGLQ